MGKSYRYLIEHVLVVECPAFSMSPATGSCLSGPSLYFRLTIRARQKAWAKPASDGNTKQQENASPNSGPAMFCHCCKYQRGYTKPNIWTRNKARLPYSKVGSQRDVAIQALVS